MALPYMPLYVGDYLRDTARLKATHHGAYLLLMMDMWNHDGLLTDEPHMMAAIARVDPKHWSRVWKKLEPLFYKVDGGWRQKRVQIEYEKAVLKSQKRAAAGALGGNRKALKYKEATKPIATADATKPASNSSSKGGSMPEPEPDKASKLALAGGLRSEFLDDVRASVGPGVADRNNCGLEFAVDLWLENGAHPATILEVVKRLTAHKRPKPIGVLRALTPEVDAAMAAQKAGAPPPTPTTAPTTAKLATDVPLPKGEARTVAFAIVEEHGQAAFNAWFRDVVWNGKAVYAPSEFFRSQIDTRFGGTLRECEYTVTLAPEPAADA